MRRRKFITLLGGAAAVWPLASRAQQNERLPRVDVLLTGLNEDDPYYEGRLTAFVEALRGIGWIDGRNLKLVIHRVTAQMSDIRKLIAEILVARPDVIVSGGGTTTGPLLQLTGSVPIVFTSVIDPVGAGFVESLAQPGGNATGFMQFDYSLSAKWLELLKQIAPAITRVGVLRDTATTSGIGQFAVIQSVASSVGADIVPINAHDNGEIERGIAKLAHSPNAGLIAASGAAVTGRRDLIISLAAQHRLPTVCVNRTWVERGGLLSYGPSMTWSSRLAAGYVDRILKGTRPADLPVQAPTRYELIINLRTAKTLGLELSASLLARADQVIE